MTNLPPRSLALVLFAVTAACAKHSGSIAGLVAGTAPRFETRTEISTGAGTHSDYRVADFNGDGRLDMAVISLTGELRILIGDGTSFVGAQEQQIGGLPSWIAGGDFDGDGDQDLVIVRAEANSTDLWLNDGSATFSPGGQIVGEADSVVVGDLNGDGNLDIAIARPGADDITVAFGDGGGSFQSQTLVTLPGGGKAFSPVIGDLDRDVRCVRHRGAHRDPAAGLRGRLHRVGDQVEAAGIAGGQNKHAQGIEFRAGIAALPAWAAVVAGWAAFMVLAEDCLRDRQNFQATAQRLAGFGEFHFGRLWLEWRQTLVERDSANGLDGG
jgi:hypothetical protein